MHSNLTFGPDEGARLHLHTSEPYRQSILLGQSPNNLLPAKADASSSLKILPGHFSLVRTQQSSSKISNKRSKWNEVKKRFYAVYGMLMDGPQLSENFRKTLLKEISSKQLAILKVEEIAGHFERIVRRTMSSFENNIKKWNQQETRFLVSLVAYYAAIHALDHRCMSDEHWEKLASVFPKQVSKEDLKLRWLSLLRTSLATHPWKPKEDALLADLVITKQQQHDMMMNLKLDWKTITLEYNQRIKTNIFRQAKQCRERWNNHLNKNINKKGWTDEDNERLMGCLVKHGKKWCEISKVFGDRTGNFVRNRWVSLEKRFRSIKISIRKETQAEEEVEAKFQNAVLAELQKSRNMEKAVISGCQTIEREADTLIRNGNGQRRSSSTLSKNLMSGFFPKKDVDDEEEEAEDSSELIPLIGNLPLQKNSRIIYEKEAAATSKNNQAMSQREFPIMTDSRVEPVAVMAINQRSSPSMEDEGVFAGYAATASENFAEQSFWDLNDFNQWDISGRQQKGPKKSMGCDSTPSGTPSPSNSCAGNSNIRSLNDVARLDQTYYPIESLMNPHHNYDPGSGSDLSSNSTQNGNLEGQRTLNTLSHQNLKWKTHTSISSFNEIKSRLSSQDNKISFALIDFKTNTIQLVDRGLYFDLFSSIGEQTRPIQTQQSQNYQGNMPSPLYRGQTPVYAANMTFW